MDGPAIAPAGRLTRDLRTEICVIGAGIAGLTTAYLAAREGRRVVVIDRGRVADGETARTTAHLTQVLDRRYYELEELHGKQGARLAAESHSAAIERMQAIIREERIACGFERVSAYLFEPPGRGTDELDREFEACRRAGIRDLAWAKRAPFKSFDTGRCLHFPNQAQMDPMRYVRGLVDAVERNGGRVVTHRPASKINGGRPGHVVLRDGPAIVADEIVVATGAPVHSRLSMVGKQTPHRTLAIGLNIPRGAVKRVLCYDTLTPYHYLRVHRHARPGAEDDLLIVGGEDHETGHADDAPKRWAALERWTRERFPMGRDLAFRWSGQVFEPHDGVALIGREGRGSHLYVVSGTSGSGMTYGTIAAILLTDFWRGDENRWARLYDPSRSVKKGQKPSSVSAAETQADDETEKEQRPTLASIRRGEGAIVGNGSRRSAVYRNEKGTIRRLSAKCTHLGCDLTWNSAEQTWDCTCHGSRFDRHGSVVSGPAIEDLKSGRGRKR
jgi:glycine/D-amino acid oxidase-like deaminating enzyme/nitrite reductase/ring-hydroxylating ferredoxin subunit